MKRKSYVCIMCNYNFKIDVLDPEEAYEAIKRGVSVGRIQCPKCFSPKIMET
jgi:transposase-like protein